MPKHVLRFWEGKFAQLRPMKRGGGRRYYRPEDIDLLRGIRWLLYSDGYTIKGVQRILRESGIRFVKDCWRGDAGPSEPGRTAGMDIPNLAGEAAKQARRGIAPGARPEPAGEKREAPVTAASPEVGPGAGQHIILSSLLRELEECRDLLTAAVETETGRSGAKKGRGEHRRGVDA